MPSPPKRPVLTLDLPSETIEFTGDFSVPGYLWTYLTFYAAGATLVASWTCFVLSIDAFAKLYPDGMVGFVFPVANMSSLLVITMFMLVAGRQLPLHVRMAGGFGSLLLSILVVPLLQLVPNIDTQVRYVGTLIMVIVTSMASALIQSSIYGLGAVFGPSFLQAIDGGKGTGAVLLVFARIATKWTYDHDTPGMLSLCVFFGLACVTIAVSWTLYVSHAFMLNNGDMLVPTALPLPSPMRSPQKQQLFQVYPFYLQKRLNWRCDQTFAPTETTPIVDKEHNTDVGSILTVLRLSWKPMSMSFVTFCVCLACYPGLTTAIQSNSIGQTWFPVVLTAAFTVGDLVGKSLPLTIRLLTLDTLHYPLVVQAAYIPLFVLAVVYSNAVSDIAAIALVTSLGFVTGYVGTSAMILAPTPCSDVEHEVAGMTGSMATIAGLFAGSYIYLMVVVADVFSAEEAELVAMQFSLANRRNARDLDKLEATVLFKEHAPEFSPHDLKTIFAGIETKGTFQLNVNEYLEIKANKKIELEAIDEEDLKRHFTVLDYHALEKTGDSGVDVLKEAIQHATTLSTDGTITFELFRVAIHDMNRKNQAAIAAGMIRIYRLQAKLQQSPAYADLCNFMIPDMVYDTDNHGPLFTNRAYRKIFLWYCLLGSLTNLQTMGRTNFLRFARDCRVADLSDRPILDADLDACYVVAIREPRVAPPQKRVVDSDSFHFHFKPTPPLFEHTTKHHSNTHGGGMTFKQWVHGTTLLLCRCLNLEEIVQEYNAAKLDVGFSKTESRESLDLNFHEFLRCIQRLAMAMNRSLSSSSSAAVAGIDGRMFAYTKHHSLVSSFQHFRSDMQSPGQSQVHLFQHTRQLHADDRQMSKVVALVQSRLKSHSSLLLPAPTGHLQPQATDISLFDHLPPLAMDVAAPPIQTTSRPTTSIRSETPKCVVPKPTHLPLMILPSQPCSPRYSATRPLSLGGSPRIKIIRPPLTLDVSPHVASPPSTTSRPPPTTAQYNGFTIPPLSSSDRPRTPYEHASGVVVSARLQ
ncbi:hypothetical protein DYB36_007461 [Aphanomyces astaci]|uniref:EF-hand domain-containing protein n=1 Tax=Aphanomyces astaci TaxID=112090 RepID=A0A397B5Y6_APHAT|nr:hypothetical protein DYB36_007461 [Aphanomyces astaci]